MCQVLSQERLPPDWFKIFSRLTKYEYVLREDVEAKLGKVKSHRICEIDTFRRVVRPLIKANPNPYGIPQGTPLSGLLANISMIEFDQEMQESLQACGGSYRRYSDDIAIVLPSIDHESEILKLCDDLLTAHGLSINVKKTCKTTFVGSRSSQICSGDIFQYLGFTYDGSKILIRPESVKNFYARMKGNIGRYIKAAAKKGIPATELRKRVLIGRFTHWGDAKNFVQYAYRAAREMQAPEIKRQLRNHVAIFDRQWVSAPNRSSLAARARASPCVQFQVTIRMIVVLNFARQSGRLLYDTMADLMISKSEIWVK
jgi:RNA-directed DNA polymerase